MKRPFLLLLESIRRVLAAIPNARVVWYNESSLDVASCAIAVPDSLAYGVFRSVHSLPDNRFRFVPASVTENVTEAQTHISSLLVGLSLEGSTISVPDRI